MSWEAPYRLDVVQRVDNDNPGLMGSNDLEFCKRVIIELNKFPGEAGKWGFNGKRGNVNDKSRDVVAYKNDEVPWGCSIIDIIGGHENNRPGANVSPAWIDQTRKTFDGGTRGVFIPLGSEDVIVPGPKPTPIEPPPVLTQPKVDACKFNAAVIDALIHSNGELQEEVKSLRNRLDEFIEAMLNPDTGHIGDILKRLDRNFNAAPTKKPTSWGWPF